MTTDAHQLASSHRGGRAQRPGPRKVYLGAALAAIAIAVIVVLAIQPGGGSQRSAVAAPRSLNLRIPTVPQPTVVTATAEHPVLAAMEGDPVTAQLAGGSTRVFVAGPAVPSWVSTEASENKLVAGATVPSTFTVSFSAAHGTVPLAADQFTLLTYQGRILHPKVTTTAGGALPATLPAGQTLNLKLTTALPEGDGTIRWAPEAKRILVAYFWTLEFD